MHTCIWKLSKRKSPQYSSRQNRDTRSFEVPSWCIKKSTVNLSLHSGKKSESVPYHLKENCHELQSTFSDYEHIFTDGSKEETKVGCAAANYNDCKQMRIPDGSSVFTAEAKDIDLALDIVKNCNNKTSLLYF